MAVVVIFLSPQPESDISKAMSFQVFGLWLRWCLSLPANAPSALQASPQAPYKAPSRRVRRGGVFLVAVLVAVGFMPGRVSLRHNAKIELAECAVDTGVFRHSATLCDELQKGQKRIRNP